MPAPSPLAIATQAVTRLVKEDKFYQKEVTAQTEKIKKLEANLPEASKTDENAEYMLRQEQKALEETKAVFSPLHEKIADAVQRLEEHIATAESEGGPEGEIAKAKEALEQGKTVAA
ncbi:tubulin binding cofactor A [Microdochium trichocladiopsis]|uniref:Tubulin-specific chaperone A n=1 Tax=Microdochium trichocladiopsis TaxID=1682393 RepID=A0A9P8YDE2_9PEZI|nr:tubulin binding cofactor A [Microdochium trichocladiopsis]KAH7034812.1 tubulin binding cofactor A [Microdochium trichocladiopsis]